VYHYFHITIALCYCVNVILEIVSKFFIDVSEYNDYKVPKVLAEQLMKQNEHVLSIGIQSFRDIRTIINISIITLPDIIDIKNQKESAYTIL
jgi:hypothetical protein